MATNSSCTMKPAGTSSPRCWAEAEHGPELLAPGREGSRQLARAERLEEKVLFDCRIMQGTGELRSELLAPRPPRVFGRADVHNHATLRENGEQSP